MEYGVRGQQRVILFQQSSGGGGAGTCFVVVEHQAAGASVWMVCAPSLKDLALKGAHAPLSFDCLPLLERVRGRMTGFGEEDRDHLFANASQSLEFHKVGSRVGKTEPD